MQGFMYKWLPRIFGCHCRADRSFYYKGRQLPICARCTGELIGIIAGILAFAFFRPKLYVLVILMLPMIIDGFAQLKTEYESDNIRRLWTGMLFGYALVTVFFMSTVWAFDFGKSVGESIVYFKST